MPPSGRFEFPADRLEKRFAEKNPPLSDTEASREAARCLYCFDAPCIRKCPTSIDFVEELPRTVTGKLQKFKLREQYWDNARKVN